MANVVSDSVGWVVELNFEFPIFEKRRVAKRTILVESGSARENDRFAFPPA